MALAKGSRKKVIFIATKQPMKFEAYSGLIMVFILDGDSFDYAHTWSKSGISIC